MKKLLPILILSALFLGACGATYTEDGNVGGASRGDLTSANKTLVGTWKTDCKVPDPKSKWAERHTFVFADDDTATYTRESFYKTSCDGTGGTDTRQYSYNIESTGKIDFMDLGAGVPFYDIYSLSGDTLQFGHGFRNDAIFGGSGISHEERIRVLNGYLLYKRQ